VHANSATELSSGGFSTLVQFDLTQLGKHEDQKSVRAWLTKGRQSCLQMCTDGQYWWPKITGFESVLSLVCVQWFEAESEKLWIDGGSSADRLERLKRKEERGKRRSWVAARMGLRELGSAQAPREKKAPKRHKNHIHEGSELVRTWHPFRPLALLLRYFKQSSFHYWCWISQIPCQLTGWWSSPSLAPSLSLALSLTLNELPLESPRFSIPSMANSWTAHIVVSMWLTLFHQGGLRTAHTVVSMWLTLNISIFHHVQLD